MADGSKSLECRLSAVSEARILVVLFLLLVPGAVIAQLPADRAPLKTCDRSRESVVVLEDTPESAARLKEAGLASGISPVVRDVLRRSGCFAQDPKASLRFGLSVTSVADDPVARVVVVSTAVRMANNEWVFEALGRGQAGLQTGAKAAKADAYAAALTSAVEDAVNNLIEAHDRATSH
jgi:hypothetical protein